MEQAPGKFITLEGGEGAGKSTQAQLLKAKLEANGKNVLLTREPGGSPGAEEIRKLLVEGEPERWKPLAETLLFLAARADHVETVIKPALASGRWVICDRFSDSTLVYQGIARAVGVEKVRALQQASLGDFAPDLTLILYLDPETGMARAKARGAASRFEKFAPDFHARLRTAFAELAKKEPARCAMIDANRDKDAVAEAIWRVVEGKLRP